MMRPCLLWVGSPCICARPVPNTSIFAMKLLAGLWGESCHGGSFLQWVNITDRKDALIQKPKPQTVKAFFFL